MQKKLRDRHSQTQHKKKHRESASNLHRSNHSFDDHYWKNQQQSWSKPNSNPVAESQRNIFLQQQKEQRIEEKVSNRNKYNIQTERNLSSHDNDKDCKIKKNKQGSPLVLTNLKSLIASTFNRHHVVSCSLPLTRLKNGGNFCYSNCVLAALLANPIVEHFIKQAKSRKGGIFQELRRIYLSSSNKVIHKIIRNIHDINNVDIFAG